MRFFLFYQPISHACLLDKSKLSLLSYISFKIDLLPVWFCKIPKKCDFLVESPILNNFWCFWASQNLRFSQDRTIFVFFVGGGRVPKSCVKSASVERASNLTIQTPIVLSIAVKTLNLNHFFFNLSLLLNFHGDLPLFVTAFYVTALKVFAKWNIIVLP